jgi:hypothetical protein
VGLSVVHEGPYSPVIGSNEMSVVNPGYIKAADATPTHSCNKNKIIPLIIQSLKFKYVKLVVEINIVIYFIQAEII